MLMAAAVALVTVLSLWSTAAMPSPAPNTTDVAVAPQMGRSTPLAVRLVGGTHCSGRVEVSYSGQWGTVCDDGWDLVDAHVVCRAVGCGWAVSAPRRAYFGEGVGPIILDEVNCTGHESSLGQCGHDGFREHDCTHSEDASVVCEGADNDHHYDNHDMETPLQIQAMHFLVGRAGEVRGEVNPVRFDLIIDNTGHGFEKISDFGYNRDHGNFTAPFNGEYRFCLSAMLCVGNQATLWFIQVNGQKRKACSMNRGMDNNQCTYATRLESGDSVTVAQQYGCSWGMTFSGQSWENNWYDWFYSYFYYY